MVAVRVAYESLSVDYPFHHTKSRVAPRADAEMGLARRGDHFGCWSTEKTENAMISM
jgi:hypothetical protein